MKKDRLRRNGQRQEVMPRQFPDVFQQGTLVLRTESESRAAVSRSARATDTVHECIYSFGYP
ncbi:hypothetical protein Barb4_02402 [Bacteroidales bacterium Barb4]|nr:hypothetical protein Barb4_02402 [Bacteroidales bacterium Barb4]